MVHLDRICEYEILMFAIFFFQNETKNCHGQVELPLEMLKALNNELLENIKIDRY